MSKRIKLKDLLKENFSGTVLGGIVSRNAFSNDFSLSKIVKEKYGEIGEEKVDVKSVLSSIGERLAMGLLKFVFFSRNAV